MQTRTRKRAWAAVVALLLAAVFAVSCQSSVDSRSKKREALLDKKEKPAAPKAEVPDSPSIGPEDAKVTIVEVTDFQCPFCKRGSDTMKKVREAYAEDVRLVFKHNPLHFHKKAREAATAAMAAAQQGEFWPFAEGLFDRQKEIGEDLYQELAAEFGLDVAKFNEDRKLPGIAERIDLDQGAAVDMGARGTPAFFVNGILLSGAKPFEEFDKAIKGEIAKANKLMEDGVPQADVSERLIRANGGTEKVVAYWLDGKRPPTPPKQGADKKTPPKKKPEDTTTVWGVELSEKDPVKGPAYAPVTIVEFSDFQCPFCTKVNPTIKKIRETYGDKVRVLFKHNPLSFHKQAQLAAEASLAAHAQGKFWEMHDLLFENQKKLERADLEGYAEQLGLDLARFRADLDSGAHKAQIAVDQELAGQINAKGTPNLYINGRQFTGAKSFEDLKPAIDEEIKKAEAKLAAGTPLEHLYESLVAKGKRELPLEDKVHRIDIGDSPVYGPRDADVTIVEFSDFECPFCARVPAVLKELVAKYDGRVRIVFKHFPLSFHKKAMGAAEASLAAHAQGRFWDMHDVLFMNQKALGREQLLAYAKMLGLDLPRFQAELANKVHRQAISADMKQAKRLKLRGTPTLFINGRRYTGTPGYTVEALSKTLEKYVLR